jgi:hypothetical protein
MSPSPSSGTPDAPDPGQPGRLGAGERARLAGLHQLAPGLAARPPLIAEAFLCAASSTAERETAAQAHEAQAEQLRGPLPAALGRAYSTLEPLWRAAGRRALGPLATLAELLSLAPAELAEQVRADLTAAGVDPDQLAWPPRGWTPPWPP